MLVNVVLSYNSGDRIAVVCRPGYLINNQTSEKRRKRESKVIGLLWLIRQYTDFLRDLEREAAMMVRAGQLGCSAVRLAAVKSSGILKCGEWPRITPLY